MDMPADQQVLKHRGVFEKFDVLEGSGDAEFGNPVGRDLVEHHAIELERAGGRYIETADQIEDGRLAGAIGADQRKDFSALDIEADLINGQHPAESNLQIACREQG